MSVILLLVLYSSDALVSYFSFHRILSFSFFFLLYASPCFSALISYYFSSRHVLLLHFFLVLCVSPFFSSIIFSFLLQTFLISTISFTSQSFSYFKMSLFPYLHQNQATRWTNKCLPPGMQTGPSRSAVMPWWMRTPMLSWSVSWRRRSSASVSCSNRRASRCRKVRVASYIVLL